MLRFERVLNRLVQLLVRSRRLCRVEVAAANYVAVGCVEVESAVNVFKITEGEVLRAPRQQGGTSERGCLGALFRAASFDTRVRVGCS